jgi:NhaA family Na+:H+ antiporter
VIRSQQAGGPEAGPGLAEHFEHRFRPISAGLAVPAFAFFSAGVNVGGLGGLRTAIADPVALGVILGLVVGKAGGVFGATFTVSKLTRAQLDDALAWVDVFGLALLAGIGFTVSLLIGELAFGPNSDRDAHVKVGVLVGSLIAAALATAVLRTRDHGYRRLSQAEHGEPTGPTGPTGEPDSGGGDAPDPDG